MISNYNLGIWDIFFFLLPPIWKTVPQICASAPHECAGCIEMCLTRSTVHQEALPTFWICFSQWCPNFQSTQSAGAHGFLRCEMLPMTSFQRSLKVGPQVLPQSSTTLLRRQRQAVLIVNWNLFQQTQWLWIHCPNAYSHYEELIFLLLPSEKDSKVGPRHEG